MDQSTTYIGRMVTAILLLILSSIGLVLNGLAAWVLLSFGTLRQTMNVYSIGKLCADILSCWLFGIMAAASLVPLQLPPPDENATFLEQHLPISRILLYFFANGIALLFIWYRHRSLSDYCVAEAGNQFTYQMDGDGRIRDTFGIVANTAGDGTRRFLRDVGA